MSHPFLVHVVHAWQRPSPFGFLGFDAYTLWVEAEAGDIDGVDWSAGAFHDAYA